MLPSSSSCSSTIFVRSSSLAITIRYFELSPCNWHLIMKELFIQNILRDLGDKIWIRIIMIHCNKSHVTSNLMSFPSDHYLCQNCTSNRTLFFYVVLKANSSWAFVVWTISWASIFSLASSFPSRSLALRLARASNLDSSGGVSKPFSTSSSKMGDTSLSSILVAEISISSFFFSLSSFSFPFLRLYPWKWVAHCHHIMK